MSLYRLRRGTPCDVRQTGAVRWRSHVCSATTEFSNLDRQPYNESPRWVFARDGWQVRVAVPMLEPVKGLLDYRVALTGTLRTQRGKQTIEVESVEVVTPDR